MKKFDTITIKECCQKIIDYRGKTPKKSSYGIKLITAKVVKDGEIKNERSEYVTPEYYEKWMTRGFAQKNDIVMTTEAPLGEVAILDSEKYALGQRIITLRANEKILNPKYLYFAMQSEFVQNELLKRATGTTVIGIKHEELLDVEIPFYTLNVQNKVVSILNAYKTLIENNNRRIAILEEMAQKLYREWFVHFRFPGHENCKMVESELGMIPEGWEIGYLSDIAYNYRKSINKNHRHNYQYYLPIDCIPKKSFALSEVREVDEAESSLIEFKKNDIVMGAMRVYFHKVICAPFDGITRSTCFVIRPRNAVFHAYLLMTIFQDSSIEYANTVSVGATMPYVVWDTFAQMKTVIPPTNIAQKYNEIVKPILRQINNIFYKNTNLRKTRDLLLPALINGDIDVSELDIKGSVKLR